MKKYFKFIYINSYIRLFKCKILNFKTMKLKGIKYFIDKNVELNINKGLLELGDKVYIKRNTEIECKCGKIHIGNNTFINTNCKIVSLDEIYIGENCLIAPNVGIYDHNHEYKNDENPICKQGFRKSKINIGNDVWLGANVVVTSGSKIGDRVIVGANSVVKGNLEAHGIYSGNPAVLVKRI